MDIEQSKQYIRDNLKNLWYLQDESIILLAQAMQQKEKEKQGEKRKNGQNREDA